MTPRVFLLSPAHCGGKRAQLLFNDRATFDLARRIRTSDGAAIGEVFSFLSGLYFRGKVAYARAFASPPPHVAGAWVITTSRGLVPIDTRITLTDLRRFGDVDIDCHDVRYTAPLRRHARELIELTAGKIEAVLLGSIATGKYVDVLTEVLGERLRFPAEFVGRGDMSRGGLMLRCADERRELTYLPVNGAIRHGKRPPKLERRTASSFLPDPTQSACRNTRRIIRTQQFAVAREIEG